MLKATVYYYPPLNMLKFGHIAVKISFQENTVPAHGIRYTCRNRCKKYEQRQKSEARINHIPILFKEDNKYIIYGNKEGEWQETELNSLSEQELNLLATNFEADCSSRVIAPEHPFFDLFKKGHTNYKRQEYFFDWGGTYLLEINQRVRGTPVCIELPVSPKSWHDFIAAAEKTPYFPHYPTRETQYDLLRNNCAHSVMQILHLAGYITEQPKPGFALTPYGAAKQICKIANDTRALAQTNLINSLSEINRNNPEQIRTLLQYLLQRLNDQSHFSGSLYRQWYKQDRELVSNINFDGSMDSIARLLEAYETVHPQTAQELEKCIAALPPGILLKATIQRLYCAADGLDKKDAAISRKLADDLSRELNAFEAATINHETFAKNCADLLAAAKPTLEKHRNYQRLFKNIALAIAGLVAFYVIAICVNKAVTGNFLFFNETKLSRMGDTIKKETNEYITPNLTPYPEP
ncbi:hypothetical protein ACFORL_06040 [Legionella dresdenensis]|uniref:DUF4105 domain-containing protein n=1 Tax=Legionella dresdenensis TaxID=450200 RepID=A0ABV8CE92_9GAMM